MAVPTFVVLFFQAGKASLLPPRPGVHKEAFGCCSQALVFPRDQVPRVRDYLTQRSSGQIDMMLDELAIHDSLDRYALYPVQAQHIGMFDFRFVRLRGRSAVIAMYPLISCQTKKGQRSVRGTAAREAQAIWSMAFEQQDPQKLRASHRQMVSLIYGGKT